MTADGRKRAAAPHAARASAAATPLVAEARDGARPLTLYFHGPRRPASARRPGRWRRPPPLRCSRSTSAALLDAVLYLDSVDALRGDERATAYQELLDGLAESAGVAILAGVQPWVPPGAGPTGTLAVTVGIPEVAERRAMWRVVLASRGMVIDEDELDALASRFRLTAHQVADAVDTARSLF